MLNKYHSNNVDNETDLLTKVSVLRMLYRQAIITHCLSKITGYNSKYFGTPLQLLLV
jgi:hypothetical protein